MFISNKKWLSSRIQELEKGSEIVQTSLGTVEFKRHGSAPYLLAFHGSPGGYDQIPSFVTPFVYAGIGYISPSRPGYLRTPLDSGRTFDEQADTFAALLDELKVDKVVAYGISGGGPSAIQFAARHPDRIYSLLLNCALTQSHDFIFGCLRIIPNLRLKDCFKQKAHIMPLKEGEWQK